MRYEVPKANSDAVEMETPAGSIEAIDPFSAPVPGQSLTTEPGSQKFERPAEISNPDDAIMFVIDRLEEDRESKEIQLSHMAAGVPIEYIVNTITFTGFSEGMWTPDVAELIKPPLAMYFIMQGMAENIPMVVFNPKPTDQSKLPPEEIAQNMSRLNPEGYEAVKSSLEEEDMQNQMMEEGFLAEGEGQPQLSLEELPTEELPTEELLTEELPTEIPSERGDAVNEFLGGFGKGFAIGYNADVAATKAADLEATKYNLQLTAAASQKKRTDDSANTINFGVLPTGEGLNYIRAYNSKGATQHADNIRGLNELANTTIDIEYGDGTTEESNYGNYLLKQYNNPKTRASVEPVVNNIMREYKNEFANYEKLMMPSGADSKGKVFNINKALGLSNLNPMFTLMNKKMVANKYKEAGINVLGDSRMPEYVDKDFTFTIKGADTVENGTVIKEGKSVPITIKSNESKAMLEKMAANTGLSVKQFLNINVNSNNRDLNDVLEIDNKGEKTVRASLILGNLHGAIREGRLDQINTETFTELTKLFLNPKDENNYLGTIDENAPKNAKPDRLSALNNLVDAVAYHLPDNIGREVSVEDSMFLVKKDTTSPTAIKAALSRHGYKNPEEVKQSFNNANKVYGRITRMFEMIEQVEGDGSAPTGSVITGITVLGRGIFDLPSQLTNVLGNEGSGEKTNFLMRMVNGKVSQYGSEKTYNRFLKRSDEGKENYKKFLIANVRGEGGSGRTFNSMADLNSKYVQYRKEKGLRGRSSFTGAELKKLKEFDKSYAAIMQMHSYLLAFEMAAAAQGGGDSRTISDRDVRIMQNVIFSKFMSTGDFKGVLGEIQGTMAMFRETHGVFSHAIQQGKGPAHIAVAGKLTAAGGPINSGKDVRENFQASIMDMAQGTQLLNQNGILIEGAEDSLYEKEYGGSDVEVNEPDVSESMNMSVQDLAQFNAPGTDQKIGDVFRTIEDKAVTNQMEFLQEDIDYILELIDKGVAAADPISPVSFYNLIGNPTLKSKLQQAYEKRGNNQLGDISQEEMDEIDNSPEARAANIYRKNSLNMEDN